MFIHHHHSFKTPLKKKTSTISYVENTNEQGERSSSNLHYSSNKQHINQLFQKFNSLSSTIGVDTTKNNFNLIEYEKEDQKIKYDPQIVTAKLRRLENQAEIHRIQMELQQRKKKRRKHQQRFMSNTNEYDTKTYKKTYQQFLTNSKLLDMPPNQSESEEEQSSLKPKGIARFHQLKKHSKILEYTMQKLKQKEQSCAKQQKQFEQRKQNVKHLTNGLKDYGQFTQMARKKIKSTVSVSSQYNPQVIIEDKFKRIMTMKAKDKVSDQVKKNPRCNKMINIQNDILLQLEQEKRTLSKQNMKKLKSRFIQIVNELQKGDKQRKQNKFLPTIDLNALKTARTTQTSKSRQFSRQNNDTIRHDTMNTTHHNQQLGNQQHYADHGNHPHHAMNKTLQIPAMSKTLQIPPMVWLNNTIDTSNYSNSGSHEKTQNNE